MGHFLHNKRSGRDGYLAPKLDLNKAYDLVKWGFSEAVLQRLRLGFAYAWVRLIMTCVSTITYSFMLNGEAKCYLTPLRGLRQGDPLSPYLFFLCVEGLSTLIRRKERERVLHGIRIADSASFFVRK